MSDKPKPKILYAPERTDIDWAEMMPTAQESGEGFDTFEELVAFNNSTKDKKPHEIMLDWATNDRMRLVDPIFVRGRWVEEARPLSIKERISLLKAAAPFYSPMLKAIEGTIKGDLTTMSTDELKAKALELLGTLPHNEQQ